MTKAMQKYNKTKDEASQVAMQAVHGIVPKIHPMLLERVDKNE